MPLAKATGPYSGKDNEKLMLDLWSPAIADDPLAFVLYNFPWGQKGTPLENHTGPRKWQRKVLTQIRDNIRDNRKRVASGLEPILLQIAIASGRGIGKSSLVAWLIIWMMSTRLGSSSIVTANSESQLSSKTWAELGKWHTLALNSHWFEKTALSLRPAPWFKQSIEEQLKIDAGYYYALATLWSKENPDSFAGAHNMKGILLIFDEASGIPAPIWSVSEGFFTEPVVDRFWLVFSNPRRNTGSFFECFHGQREFWIRENIDSREVEGTDKNLFAQIIKKYGEDSDEARKEVKGQFPRQGDKQFISMEVVQQAVERELVKDIYAPLIMGVDPARYGSDKLVIRFRRGRDARSFPVVEMKSADNMKAANRIAELIDIFDPDAVCIDAGNGTGIIDRLRELKYKVHEVWFGAAADSPEWANVRTEIWDRMREWLKGGCIDDHKDLKDDLVGPEYRFQGISDKIMLEPKEDMKDRGLSSPDNADALACTFAVRVARSDSKTGKRNHKRVLIADGVNSSAF